MLHVLARGRGPQTPGEWLLFGGLVAMVIIFMAIRATMDRKRRAGIRSALVELGFVVDDGLLGPDSPELAFITGNPILRYTRNRVAWCAAGLLAGRTMQALEYTYVTGGGKHSRTHRFLIAATDLPLDVPPFVAERSRSAFFSGRTREPAKPLGAGEIGTDSTVSVYGESVSGARLILTARVRALLEGWPKDYWLQFGSGMLVLGCEMAASPEQVREHMDTLVMLADLVETDLGWQKQTSPR